MATAGGSGGAAVGKVACAAWVRRREDDGLFTGVGRLFVACGRAPTASSPPLLDLVAFDARTTALAPEPLVRVVMGEEGSDAARAIAVHPDGSEFVCATAKGCRVFKLLYEEIGFHLISRDVSPLQSVGPQKCLAFSTDGAKFAIGGEELYSAFLVSTSTDGSARIWKLDVAAPLVNLTRSSDEKIECCRFSRDGTKPFLFCTIVKGHDVSIMVLDISNWKRIGYKRLSAKPISILSISLDGKYLALGNRDGDFCAVDVKKMEISHWSRKVHLGSPVSSIEFCPTERVVISTSPQWGAEITKLGVPADWKVWQIWLVLLSLFVVSAVLFYVFFKYARLNLR
ncbi:hypothetical protein ACP4OV_008364 [Aristida adscensionis]